MVAHVGIPEGDMLAKAATFIHDPETAARFICLPLVQLSFRHQVLMEDLNFTDLEDLHVTPLRLPKFVVSHSLLMATALSLLPVTLSTLS